MKRYRYYSVLTIAGSDSGGGAGIQADLKTFSALGCFGTSAVTAITVQNTCGVYGIHSIPPAIVQEQIKAVMDDIQPGAIKIGMVHTAELASAIASTIKDYPVPVVFDPVMVATSGDLLMENDTMEILKKELFPLSSLVTPNLHEAAILADMKILNLEDMKTAASRIIRTGCQAVLVKGSHFQSDRVYDLYVDKDGREEVFESDFIHTNNTHGTGCTLSSAIAAFMATGLEPIEAITEARVYVHQAIDEGKDVRTGKGNGPLNHFFNPQRLIKYDME